MATMRFRQLCRPLAVLFPLVALLGVGVPTLLGMETLAVLGVYIAIPLLFGGLSYFAVRDRPTGGTNPTVAGRSFKPLVTEYAACQAIAILLVAVLPVRPLAYYLVIAAAATVVLIQILRTNLTPTRVGVILVQCGALILNVIWGVTFKYEFFFGRTDLFPHTWYAKTLLETGHVTAAFENYEWFPLWHILAVIERFYFGVNVAPRYLFFLTSGIAYAVLVAGIYLLARKLFDSRRIALVAALLTCLNTWVLLYGMYSIPRSIVAVFSVFAFAAIIGEGKRSFVVFLFLAVGIVAYHPVSAPFILVIFTTVYVVQNAFESGWTNHPVHYRDLLTIGVFHLLYLAVAAQDLFESLVNRLVSPSIAGSSGVQGTGANIPNPVHELTNYLQFSLLLLFVAVALVVGLRSDRFSWEGKVVILSGALLSIVSFPGPMLLVSKLSSNFNMLRFGQYTFPLIVIGAAVGIILLVDADIEFGGPKATKVFRGTAILLVVSMAFLAVSNDFVASDNPTVEREFYTFSLSESETEGYETVRELHDGQILTDRISCKYVRNVRYDGSCTILQTDTDRERLLTGDRPGLVVLRTTELQRRGLQVFPTDEYDSTPAYLYEEEYVSGDAQVWDTLDRRNRVLDSDDVTAFTTASASENTTAALGSENE